MPQDRYDRLIKLFERLGIATVFACALFYGGWRIFSWFGTKIAEPFANEQLGMMKQTRESIKTRDENDRLSSLSNGKLADELRGLKDEFRGVKEEIRLLRKGVFAGDGPPVAVQPRNPEGAN